MGRLMGFFLSFIPEACKPDLQASSQQTHTVSAQGQVARENQKNVSENKTHKSKQLDKRNPDFNIYRKTEPHFGVCFRVPALETVKRRRWIHPRNCLVHLHLHPEETGIFPLSN